MFDNVDDLGPIAHTGQSTRMNVLSQINGSKRLENGYKKNLTTVDAVTHVINLEKHVLNRFRGTQRTVTSVEHYGVVHQVYKIVGDDCVQLARIVVSSRVNP